MFKKMILAGAAVLLVGGLLFGGKALPYAQTLFQQVRNTAEDSLSVEFQLDAAENQLPRVKDQIWHITQQVAKEKSQIKKLTVEIDRLNDSLEQSRDEMLTLKEHLSSDEQVYVATNGRAYTNTRVKEDLRHRYSVYLTTEATRDKQVQILDLREQALQSAVEKMEDVKSVERELHVQIENLRARARMVEVAEAASTLNIDDSQLARTQEMLDDISARIDVKEEMLTMAPEYLGQIPVSADSDMGDDGDIVDQIEAHFSPDASAEDFVSN